MIAPTPKSCTQANTFSSGHAITVPHLLAFPEFALCCVELLSCQLCRPTSIVDPCTDLPRSLCQGQTGVGVGQRRRPSFQGMTVMLLLLPAASPNTYMFEGTVCVYSMHALIRHIFTLDKLWQSCILPCMYYGMIACTWRLHDCPQ